LKKSHEFLVTFPIDLTKTRLQIQGQIFDNPSQKSQYGQKKYTNMFQAIYRSVIHIRKKKLSYRLFISELVEKKVYGNFIPGME
jgi:hypothetical protein